MQTKRLFVLFCSSMTSADIRVVTGSLPCPSSSPPPSAPAASTSSTPPSVCFARSGFHRTTMQDICKEALISPGALYVYFSSKEDLIAGITERDRAEFAERFAELAGGARLHEGAGATRRALLRGGARPQARDVHRDRARVDAQSQGRRDLPLGRPLLSKTASRSCSPASRPRGASRPSSTSRPSPRCSPSSATGCSGAARSIRISTPRRSYPA